MTLLESMSSWYKHMITFLETMSMKELTMKYVMRHLMYKMSKKKEKESQGDDLVIMLY